MADSHQIERDLQTLAAELRRLEAEYNMYFAGRLPRPPWETRNRVESIVKYWDTNYIETSAERFRFSTLQSRFISFRELWDKGMRAREEGRPSPFAHGTSQVDRSEEGGRVVHEAAFSNPRSEMDKVEDLYQSLMSARRDAGQEVVPFHRFANFVRDQVKQYKESGDDDVAFRVAVKDGQVSFTVRGGKR